jgi:hypothetical protein
MTDRLGRDLVTPVYEEWIGGDGERAYPKSDEGCEGGIDVAFGARMDNMNVQSKCAGAACASLVAGSAVTGLLGLTRTAMTRAVGTISCNFSTCFCTSSVPK